MSEPGTDETIEGYVVDIECVRGYPRDDTLRRARQHTRECLLMGHCIESGYAIVGEDDRVTLLDAQATHRVLQVAQKSAQAKGLKLCVKRTTRDGAMETFAVEELDAMPARAEKVYPE